MAMQEPTFLILTVLAGPPLHGYGIMQAIDEISAGAVKVAPGTLYAALDRLCLEGLVDVAGEESFAAGRIRRFYRLTPQGAAALRAESERRRQLARVAARRLASYDALGGAAC